MERHDSLLTNLHQEQPRGVSNAGKKGRREPRVDIWGEYEVRNDIDKDASVESELGRMRNRGVRHERRGRDLVGDEVYRSMSNIKMTISSFKGMSDQEAYLEWEKKIELIFDCHNYLEDKNIKIAELEFTNYAITW